MPLKWAQLSRVFLGKNVKKNLCKKIYKGTLFTYIFTTHKTQIFQGFQIYKNFYKRTIRTGDMTVLTVNFN